MAIRLCLTGQHRELVSDVLEFFDIRPDYDLKVMDECSGDLTCLTSLILTKIKEVLVDFCPDCVLVQGDTTSAFAVGLAAFYSKLKLGHIEAGLRTFDKENPFPEEFNRAAISRMADFHFAPTETAKSNLLTEKIPVENILVTGNTVIDALFTAKERISANQPKSKPESPKILLVTIHRRENQGPVFRGICLAIRELSKMKDWQIIFTLHPNSSIFPIAMEMLKDRSNIKLLEPQPYGEFILLMLKCDLILTDSGGIQEEATVLNKPVLLARKKTERPEAEYGGVVTLVGNEKNNIIQKVGERMDNFSKRGKIIEHADVFGDGKASERIVEFLRRRL